VSVRGAALAVVALAHSTVPAAAQMSYGDYGDHAAFNHCVDGHRPTDERIAGCTGAVSTGTGKYDAALIVLSSLYLRARQPDKALDAADRLLDRFDDSLFRRKQAPGGRVAALEARGTIYAATGRLDDALKDSDEVFAISTDDADSYANRCRLRAIAGRDLDAAMADCNKADASKPRNASTLAVRALANVRLARWSQALADADAALDENARFVWARYLRGVVEKRMGDAAAADADIAWARAHDAGIEEQAASWNVAP
jgi:tetratricopeptide (TPR) repeat protein